MQTLPTDLRQTFESAGQPHVWYGWDTLEIDERERLVVQLKAIDLPQIQSLYQQRNSPQSVLPAREAIAPIPVLPVGDLKPSTVRRGEDALRRGEVGVLVVAGGQGSRLKTLIPKGMFAVGPVSGATLFRIHAEKVLAMSQRYGRDIPFLIMTSRATHEDTVAYFESEKFFGLKPKQVHFFQQDSMPALDIATGRLLLEKPGSLFLSPNGHGGTLTALADSGLLNRLKSQGIRHIFYFQVDNPLVKVAEPAFLGQHIEADSEASSKVVFKEKPEEKVGVLALIGGKCGIVEYSDMPKAMTEERTLDGTLAFRAGNPAIHIFSVAFLERVTSGDERLAYHVAKKKVKHFDSETATEIAPSDADKENALKFELFIFDALPLAKRWFAVECKREEEFAPLKNASGPDSLETVQAAMLAQSRRWLQSAGVQIPENAMIEISPLYALDVDELQRRKPRIEFEQYYLR